MNVPHKDSRGMDTLVKYGILDTGGLLCTGLKSTLCVNQALAIINTLLPSGALARLRCAKNKKVLKKNESTPLKTLEYAWPQPHILFLGVIILI